MWKRSVKAKIEDNGNYRELFALFNILSATKSSKIVSTKKVFSLVVWKFVFSDIHV